jgi:hypothetical protein
MYLVAVFALALLAFPVVAHAYIDPSAGSIVLQMVLGGIAGVSVLAKLYYRKVMSLLRRGAGRERSEPDEGADRLR